MANKKEYTHYAKMYGIPCYFNDATSDICGRNKFYDLILDMVIWLDINIPSNYDGFEIKIIKEIK